MKVINRSVSKNNLPEFWSDTSVWSLVPHKVTPYTAEIWAGTLFPYLRKPALCRLIVYKDKQELKRIDIKRAEWDRPILRLSNRFFTLSTLKNLESNQHYQVTLFQQLEDDAGEYAGDWLYLKSAYFNTLPMSLPTANNDAFTVSLNSCFYEHRDNGTTAEAFKNLYSQGNGAIKPDVKFMVGDQVYLDIGADSLSPLTNEVRKRIADDYAKHWQALGSMLSRGASWMLPDDHEYWNDYPFYDSLVPTLFMLKIPKIRNAWSTASKNGVERIQQTHNPIETFTIGNDLSFCIADLRSTRTKTQFINKKGFKKLIGWAKGLTTPGVLVIPQILIVGENKHERNLLSFKRQYAELLEALAHSGRDIVVLSGDVHFGRICSVSFGNKGAKLIEIVASPTSNLTGINSVATAKPTIKPKSFPDIEASWEPQTVKYDFNYNVKVTKGKWFSSYWRERTNEHFMTISFNKKKSKINMTVQAWLVRRADVNGMPKSQFQEPYSVTLK